LNLRNLLWLLLIFRVLCVLAPFLVGFVVTLLVFGHVHPILPRGWTALIFVFFVLFVAGTIKSGASNRKNRSSSRDGRRDDRD